MSTGPGEFLHGLEVEVEADLGMIADSRPEEAAAAPVTEWLVDPAEVEREQIGLRSLLGAVEALEGDAYHHGDV
ncbi:hypothetical protein FB561_4389 [Kribbella amoyensis]|uniref:Uncharacterized protein n=1 Tax=Kribbella amoyensis TaxID=996641 RepID=A0A561BWH4_9ACTN|nr:hypothetical protein [Kribbella amoyensis]TWD83229.1 hypothetical protein FB561_4389 [Kribbella amoyensis]